MKYKAYIFILFLTTGSFLYGQAHLQSGQFKGHFNFVHPIELNLEINGAQCKGQYTLLSSGETFWLEGEQKDGAIHLAEQDSLGNTSGFLKGKINKQEIIGEWSNLAQDQFIPFRFAKKEKEVGVAIYQKFAGQLLDSDAEISVQRYLDQEVSAFLWLENKQEYVPLQGHYQAQEKSLFLFSTDPNKTYFTSIELKHQVDDTYDVVVLDVNGRKKFTTFELSNSYAFALQHFADYYNMFDISYPIFEKKAFDEWLSTYVKNWMRESDRHGKIQSILNKGNVDKLRFSNQVYGWTDISFLSSTILSGQLILQNPSKKLYEKKSFLFDLKSKKILELDDLFTDTKKIKSFIQKDAKPKLLAKQEIKESRLLSEWLSQQELKHVHFESGQFVFSTDFHPIFGEHLVAYTISELKPYLKKSSFNRFSK